MSTAAPLLTALAVVVAAHRVVRPVPVAPHGRRILGLVGDRAHGPTAVRSALDHVPAWFRAAAHDADLTPAHRWWLASRVAVVAGGLVGLAVGGPVLGALAATGALTGIGVALCLGRHRRAGRISRSVPAALDAVARSCRAGASVLQALRELDDADVGPAGPVFAAAATQVDRGVALDAALDELVAAQPVPAVRLATTALLVGSLTGAAPARAVEGVAATIRDHLAIEREAAANATQARASAAVLVLAPVAFTLVVALVDDRVAHFLFRTPVGLVCLVLGVALDVVGAWWMGRLVRGPR